MKIILSSLLLGLGLGLPALADTSRLEIDFETSSFSDQVIEQGPIRVVVSYDPIDYDAAEVGENLRYELFYNGELKLSLSDTAAFVAGLELIDLDSNGIPEVVVETFTGGAHCCLAITTYTWQAEQFNPIYFAYLDGGGGRFEDLDGDGKMEFITLDNAFFYSFSSYAGSYPPSVILTYEDGQYRDTTAQFTADLEAVVESMRLTLNDPDFVAGGDANGVLAGYVAQNIRLGDFKSAWQFMLAHYDRQSDWGLESYTDGGEVAQSYPDFPTALYAFLKDLGYLDASGVPQPEVDRSPVVADRDESL